MIETTILNYLNEALDVPVLMELPEVPSEDFPVFPQSLVIIELIGRTVENYVTNASIALQSYGATLYQAAALDEQVRMAMDRITETTGISGAHLASNYNHTDPDTKRYRYQCVYEIYYVKE